MAIIRQKGVVRFILSIVMVLIVGDIWDRLAKLWKEKDKVAQYETSDYVMILVLIIIIILYVRNKVRNARQIKHKTRNT